MHDPLSLMSLLIQQLKVVQSTNHLLIHTYTINYLNHLKFYRMFKSQD